jgi:hypothetical protein
VPSKLFIHVEPEAHFVAEPPDFVELCRLPLEGGPSQSYLVLAKGLVGPEVGVNMRLKLDVFGFFGELLTSQQSDYINDHQQFMLMAAATLPAEGGGVSPGTPPPPGASANLSVRTFWPTPPGPGHSVYATDMILMALSVDEVVAA